MIGAEPHGEPSYGAQAGAAIGQIHPSGIFFSLGLLAYLSVGRTGRGLAGSVLDVLAFR